MLKLLDLFSGIGGFSLGLESTGGFRTIAFCEKDNFCQKILQKNWPDTPIFKDVKELPYEQIGAVDIITAGFPCQPWSNAGKRKGSSDERDLWPETFSAIKSLRPRWFIGENVRGFVSQELGLSRSLNDLESIDYKTQGFLIPATSFRPHRRERVWIMGYTSRSGSQGGTLSGVYSQSESQGARVQEPQRRGSDMADTLRAGQQSSEGNRKDSRDKKRHYSWGGSSNVAYTSEARLQEWETQDPEHEGENGGSFTKRSFGGKLKRRLGGVAYGISNWMDEPRIPRTTTKQPDRVNRIKALGNSIVPQIVAELGSAILVSEKIK